MGATRVEESHYLGDLKFNSHLLIRLDVIMCARAIVYIFEKNELDNSLRG